MQNVWSLFFHDRHTHSENIAESEKTYKFSKNIVKMADCISESNSALQNECPQTKAASQVSQ